MRKYSLLFLALVVALFVSCDRVPYKVGDIGPAGGYIVYDCDKDNRRKNNDGLTSAECGWRYIEIAPSVAEEEEQDTFVFGYFRSSDSGTNTCSDGSNNVANSESFGIGKGKGNTRQIVDAVGDSAYTSSDGSTKTAYYAAKVADAYSVTVGGVTYDDWFLPSVEELSLIGPLKSKKFDFIKNDKHYWTSSEGSAGCAYRFSFFVSGGYGYGHSSSSNLAHVICMRTFLPEE